MLLTHWKRALALGFLSWLLPFVFSFLVFPLKQANAPLFETIMSLAVILVAAVLATRYFRGVTSRLARGALLRFLLLALNPAFGLPQLPSRPHRLFPAPHFFLVARRY